MPANTDIVASIRADNSGLASGIKQAQGMTAQLNKGGFAGKIGDLFQSGGSMGMLGKMGAIGVAVGAAVTAISKLTSAAASMADSLQNISDATGITSERFQNWADAARGAGVTQDELAQKVMKLRDAQADALNGNEKTIENFKRFGITMADLASMDPEQLFEALAKGAIKAGNSAQNFAALTDLMGKNAGKMMAVFKEMGGNINGLEKDITHMSDIAVARIDAMGDKWAHFKSSVVGFWGNMLGDMLGFFMTEEDMQKERERRDRVAADKQMALAAQVSEAKKVAEQKRLRDLVDEADKYEKQEAKRDKRIAELKEQLAERLSKITVGITAADSMTKIGAFSGARVDPSLSIAEKSLRVQEETLQANKEIKKVLEEELTE